MASTYLPVVFNNLPPIIGSHHLWAAIWLFSLLFFKYKIFFSKSMVYVMAYGVGLLIAINTIWSNIDPWNVKMLFQEFYAILIGTSVISYIYMTRDYLCLARITKWALLFIFITAIMTIISSFVDPMYMRNIVGAARFGDDEREAVLAMQRYGGAGYGYAIAFISIIPTLIFYIKCKNKIILSYQLFILLIFIFVALFATKLFANIIIAMTFGSVALVSANCLKRTSYIVAALLLVTLLLPYSFYYNVFNKAGDLLSDESHLNKKFEDVAFFIESLSYSELKNIIEERNSGTAARANRYFQLYESFHKSPLLGVFFNDNRANGYFTDYFDYGKIGQVEGTHLHWMNKLTITGIIGLCLFVFIVYTHIQKMLIHFNDQYKNYFMISVVSFISYGFLKTIAGREGWYAFFILLPGIYYLPLCFVSKKREKKLPLTVHKQVENK